MSKRSLFAIGQDMQAFVRLLDESGGELLPEHEGPMDDWFSCLAEDQADKLASYCGVIDKLKVEAEYAKGMAKSYKAKAEGREATVARMHARMLEHMLATDQKAANTSDGRVVRWQNNGGVRALDIQADMVPAEYKYTPEPVPDADRIRQECEAYEKAVEQGVDPADLGILPLDFATLKPRTKGIRIA